MKMKSKFVVGVLGIMTFSSAFATEDRVIWLQPGQCIIVGSQQVCDAKPGDTSATTVSQNKQTHICKNGIQDEADPTLKGWAHVILTMGPDGKKLSQETIKTYGPMGKKECDADVAKASN